MYYKHNILYSALFITSVGIHASVTHTELLLVGSTLTFTGGLLRRHESNQSKLHSPHQLM